MAAFKNINLNSDPQVFSYRLSKMPTSRGLSAGSSDCNRFLDPADKPRDVGVVENQELKTAVPSLKYYPVIVTGYVLVLLNLLVLTFL